ncbi:hypothetical protein [Marinobacter sp.]|uniref:hypothetical protein n=1 Tax=Marinobacter sp. TaxID=50741 RepID=UPI002B2745F5|nr:hypothetical protein [Marinobacter sp.]
MELGLLIYWMVFYSALAGWYARTAPIIRNNGLVEFRKYIIPRILLAHSFAAFILLFAFYFLSILDNNKWVLIFPALGTLAAVEYFWLRMGEWREKLISSLTVRIGSLISAVVVFFYFSSLASTHLERLTKVSPGVFDSFIYLLTIMLSSVVWVLLAQLLVTILSLLFLLKIFVEKDDYAENLLFVFTSAVTAGFFLILAIDVVYKKAIPYALDNYFLDMMYHENKDLDDNLICSNLDPSQQVVILPSGRVSLAHPKDDGGIVFSVSDCIIES